MYKYNPRWSAFIVRAEEMNEFYAESRTNFRIISAVIIVMTVIIGGIGIFILRFLLRYIDVITRSIMRMVKSQQLDLIDLSGATNDDITYLGAAFNSLSSTVDNLITIFRKFANQDIVNKAYRDRVVKLEGTRRELTILFSDIKSFTFITETLGTDIIKLLNLHYDRAIREIVNLDGVIGSIIGDALLAVFGVLEDSGQNKSYQAVMSAYQLQEVTETLRIRMSNIRDEIDTAEGEALRRMRRRSTRRCSSRSASGIDGGEVFYGTLGSYVRMTNTVIGDNVNAASRMEGLTRVYKVPVICSEYVRNDIETTCRRPRASLRRARHRHGEGEDHGPEDILARDWTAEYDRVLSERAVRLRAGPRALLQGRLDRRERESSKSAPSRSRRCSSSGRASVLRKGGTEYGK